MSLLKNSLKSGFYVLSLSLLLSSNFIVAKDTREGEAPTNTDSTTPTVETESQGNGSDDENGDQLKDSRKSGDKAPESKKEDGSEKKEDSGTPKKEDPAKDKGGIKTRLSNLLVNRKVWIAGGISLTAAILAVVFYKLNQEKNKSI